MVRTLSIKYSVSSIIDRYDCDIARDSVMTLLLKPRIGFNDDEYYD